MKQDFVIELQEGPKPQKKGLYRLSDKEMSGLRKWLKETVEAEFILPSKGPCEAPVSFMSKKGSGVRICVDCRPLHWLNVKTFIPYY